MPREPQWTLKDLADHVGEDVCRLAAYFKHADIAPIEPQRERSTIATRVLQTKVLSNKNKSRYNRSDLLRWYKQHKKDTTP